MTVSACRATHSAEVKTKRTANFLPLRGREQPSPGHADDAGREECSGGVDSSYSNSHAVAK